MEKTYFISFEGIDGSGKDTQLQQLAKLIKEDDGYPFGNKYSNIWITRNPTKFTPYGIKISNLIRHKQVSGEEASMLYVKDRIEQTKLIKSFLKHSHVLCSRYDISTLAYQSAQGQDLEELYQMHGFEKGHCIEPDLTIIFDIDPKVSLARTCLRGEARECFENLEFLQKARVEHMNVTDFLRKKGRQILIVNSNQSIEDVTKEMCEGIVNFMRDKINKKNKIYFAGSIRGGRNDIEDYKHIVNYLNFYGEILTQQVADDDIDSSGEDIYEALIYEREINKIKQCDVLIADVSTPSLGVGYEIGKAIEFGKPVLCLYKKGSKSKLSAMVSGSPFIILLEYNTLDEIKQVIDSFFKDLGVKINQESNDHN